MVALACGIIKKRLNIIRLRKGDLSCVVCVDSKDLLISLQMPIQKKG